MNKYRMTHQWLQQLILNLKVHELNRIVYQQIINDYAIYHERQIIMDFHHQLKGAILDAVDEGLITHASLLLFAGVSIASVARRLGHASMTTTQKTYLHIIRELENKDIDLVMRSLSSLN